MAASLGRVNDAVPATPTETPAPDASREALPKGEQAKALILKRGYDRTTMRAIASEAGVSVGNAYYYYYEGKEFRSICSSDFASSGTGSVGGCGRRDDA